MKTLGIMEKGMMEWWKNGMVEYWNIGMGGFFVSQLSICENQSNHKNLRSNAFN